MLGRLARLEATWATWTAHNLTAVKDTELDIDTDQEQPLARALPRFLASPPALLRLTAASQLLQLAPSPLLPWLHAALLPALTHSLPSSLALLSSLSLPLPSLTTPLLSSLLTVSREAGDTSLLPRAVALVAANRQTSPHSLLQAALPSLLYSHLSQGLPPDSFPRHLLGPSDLPTFLTSQEELVPLVLLQEPSQARLAWLGAQLQLEPREVLKVHLSGLARLSVPGLAAESAGLRLEGGVLGHLGREDMCRLANLLEEGLPEHFQKLVAKTFVATMQHSLSHVHDPLHLQATFGLESAPDLVPPSPPALPASVPAAMAALFSKTYGPGDLWQIHALHTPEAVVRVCVALSSALTHPALSLVTERLRALHSLFLWLDSIAPSLPDPALLPLLPVLCLQPAVCLLHLLHSTRHGHVLRAGLVTLQKLVAIMTPVCSSALQPVLFSLTYCLVDLVRRLPAISSLALDSLHLLFLRNGFRFTATLSLLEDFPATEQFSSLQAAVARERPAGLGVAGRMANFLEVAATTEHSFLAIPLASLLGHLQEDYTDQKVEQDLLRRLLACLLQVVRGDCSSAASLALRCLGEVGPVQLDSPLLQVQQQASTSCEFALAPSMKYVGPVLEGLKAVLLGPDGAVSLTAARAVTAILSSTREGRAWLQPRPGEEVTTLQEVLAPFQRRSRVPREPMEGDRVDVEEFKVRLDSPAVWLGQGEGHREWLTRLVLALLNCFRENTALHHLAEVCSLSLSLCHTVLPFIVHELLLQNCPDIRLVLSAKFCIFFREHFEAVTSVPRSTTVPPLAHLREDSVASLLSVVTYMREQPLPHHLKASAREQNCWEQNFWLANINYLHCAQVLQTV